MSGTNIISGFEITNNLRITDDNLVVQTNGSNSEGASLDITGDLRIGSINSINSNELIISNQNIAGLKLESKTSSSSITKTEIKNNQGVLEFDISGSDEAVKYLFDISDNLGVGFSVSKTDDNRVGLVLGSTTNDLSSLKRVELNKYANPNIFYNYNSNLNNRYLGFAGTNIRFHTTNDINDLSLNDIRVVMTIDNSGNMGIGTNTPNAKLDIRGHGLHNDVMNSLIMNTTQGNSIIRMGRMGMETDESFSITKNIHRSSNYRRDDDTTGFQWLNFEPDGDFGIITGPPGEGTTSVPTRLIVKNDGKVGIGTTTPSCNLDVYDTNTASLNTEILRIYSQATGSGFNESKIRIEKGTDYGGFISGFLEQGVGSGLKFTTNNGGNEKKGITIKQQPNEKTSKVSIANDQSAVSHLDVDPELQFHLFLSVQSQPDKLDGNGNRYSNQPYVNILNTSATELITSWNGFNPVIGFQIWTFSNLSYDADSSTGWTTPTMTTVSYNTYASVAEATNFFNDLSSNFISSTVNLFYITMTDEASLRFYLNATQKDSLKNWGFNKLLRMVHPLNTGANYNYYGRIPYCAIVINPNFTDYLTGTAKHIVLEDIAPANANFNDNPVDSGGAMVEYYLTHENMSSIGPGCIADKHNNGNPAQFTDPATVLRHTSARTVGKGAGRGLKNSTSLSILAPGENQEAKLYFGTQHIAFKNVAKKAAIIVEGINSWSRSKMHFCLNNYTSNDTWNNARLDRDEIMTLTPDGNVGIGITTPQTKLEVIQDTAPSSLTNLKTSAIFRTKGFDNNDKYINIGTYYNLSTIYGGGTSTAYNLVINPPGAAGKVGIGIVPTEHLHICAPYGTSTNILLENNDTALTENQLISKIAFKQNDSTTNGTGNVCEIKCVSVNTGYSGTYYGESADLVFSTGTYANNNSNNDVLTISHGGNVGIRTRIPGARLTFETISQDSTFSWSNGGNTTGSVAGIDVDPRSSTFFANGISWKSKYSSWGSNDLSEGPSENVARIFYQPVTFRSINPYSGDYLGLYRSGRLVFTCGDTEAEGKYARMVINSRGNVGIGTSNPGYPLEVGTGIGGSFSGTYSTFKSNDATVGSGLLQSSVPNSSVSIKTQAMIWAQGNGFIASSDLRIKKNVIDVSDNKALTQLRDISCVTYKYKDTLARGTDTTIGFIAQQVKQHMPMAVSIQKHIIPSEMRNIENPLWTTLTDSSGNNTFKLTINDLNDNSGNTLHRFYVSNDSSANDECKKEIYSLLDDPKSFIFNEQWTNVFLYGKEVNDFHTLDKQKLFALNFSATQEIDRIQQEEKTKLEEANQKIVELETKNQELENQNNTISSKIVELENKNQELENKNQELENKNITISTKISSLENQNNVLTSKIADLENQMYEIKQLLAAANN